MKKALFIILALFVVFTVISNKEALSWVENTTHRSLSEFAALDSVLSQSNGDYLRNLGFNKELLEEFKWNDNKRTVKDWIQEGAELEDKAALLFPVLGKARSVNHFHNPLKPWSIAGLDDTVLLFRYTGQSSLLWSQDGGSQQNFPEADWSWRTIRNYYYLALTSANDSERQSNFAKTFRGLGHQMHLIQDGTQPDHVRNNAHPWDTTGLKRWIGIEKWANDNPTFINSLASDPNVQLNFSPQVSFDVSYNDLVPITQLFDASKYSGGNPSRSLDQGVSEYTNANFFSDGTIFAAERYPTNHGHYFPYPKRGSTDLQSYINGTKPSETIIIEDGHEATGFWISKVSDGETVNHFLRAGLLTPVIYKLFGEGGLFYSSFYRDEECHKDYARKLIPRAVSYSAGLVNSFFRGRLGVEQTGVTPNGKIEITITNLSDDTLVAGEFELYYDNDIGERQKINDLSPNSVANLRRYDPEKPETMFKATFSAPTDFDAQKKSKYMLVYSGKMGLEEKAYIGKYGVISRDFLVFYKKDGVVKVNLMDLREIDSINASPLDPKVASELGFSINDSKPFSTMQRPFTHQGKTIHLFGSGIRLRDDSYISSGGGSDSYNTQHFYVYDPQITQYFYLSDTYDLSYNYPPVFNVGSDRIYISKGEYWGVDIFSYANGVVMSYGNKIPSYPDYYRTFYVDGSGWAYFRKPDETQLVSGEVGVANAPLIRSLNGIRIAVKEAKEGQEYGINLYMFLYSHFPSGNTYYDGLYYGQGAPLGDISYTAVKGDTVKTIASKLAVRVNIATTWQPGWIRWPAAADGNSIIIKEDDASVGLGPHVGIGTSGLRGPMILLDYYPYAFDSEYVSPTTIKRNNLVDDVSETVFVELLSNSPNWVPWELNVYNSKQLLCLLSRSTPSPWETWHQWELNRSGSLTIRKKNEIFKSTVASLNLEFVDGDLSCNVDQHAKYKDVNLTQPGNPEEHQIDATVDEVVGCTYNIGPYINSSRLLTHHTAITQHRKSGGGYGENMGDLLEKWNADNNSGDVRFINFPMAVGSKLFYEIDKRGYTIDATGRLKTAGDRNFLIDRGNPPFFIEEETKLVTPYETIILPIGRNFSYGWCHVEDADRGVLIQGLQLTERSEVLPGYWDDIYFPVLYSNGVRIEEVLATKLGCASTDILGIIYYPGVNSDPGRSIWF